MELHTFEHETGARDRGALPDIDSERTLVVAFGASSAAAGGGTFPELTAAFPRSTVIGCSTAGEISPHAGMAGELHDQAMSLAIAEVT